MENKKTYDCPKILSVVITAQDVLFASDDPVMNDLEWFKGGQD